MIPWFWIWVSIFFKTSCFSKRWHQHLCADGSNKYIFGNYSSHFFHEKYQGLNVVLPKFRGLEKYRQYRDNHCKKRWWDDRQKKPTLVTTSGGKNRKILKNFRGSIKQTPRLSVLRLRHDALPLTQFCYTLKMHVSKFSPCTWGLKSRKDSQPKVSFNCFYRCHHHSCCKISFQFSL